MKHISCNVFKCYFSETDFGMDINVTKPQFIVTNNVTTDYIPSVFDYLKIPYKASTVDYLKIPYKASTVDYLKIPYKASTVDYLKIPYKASTVISENPDEE